MGNHKLNAVLGVLLLIGLIFAVAHANLNDDNKENAEMKYLTQQESERRTRVHDDATNWALTKYNMETCSWKQRRVYPILSELDLNQNHSLTLWGISHKDIDMIIVRFRLNEGEFDQNKITSATLLDNKWNGIKTETIDDWACDEELSE